MSNPTSNERLDFALRKLAADAATCERTGKYFGDLRDSVELVTRLTHELSGNSPLETSPDPLDYKLPCEVRIPPSTSFGKGVTLRALMHGLRAREGQPDEVTRFHDERAKAIRNALRFSEASLEKACQCDSGPEFGQVCNTCGGLKGFTQETSDSVVGDASTASSKVEGTPRGEYTLAPGLHEETVENERLMAEWRRHARPALPTGEELRAPFGDLLRRLDDHKETLEEPRAEDTSNWWKCPNCLSRNDPVMHHTSCPCCGTLKPSEKAP